jgi:hypothetical protein
MPMTPETQQRFDELLTEVHRVQGQLRDALVFKTYMTELVRRHAAQQLSDAIFIERVYAVVAHELDGGA